MCLCEIVRNGRARRRELAAKTFLDSWNLLCLSMLNADISSHLSIAVRGAQN